MPLSEFARRHRVALLAVLATVCVTVFLGAGTIGVTFLSDDVALITWGREAIGPGFWRPWLGNQLTGEAGSPPYYRPLTLVSHGVDAALWGWTPAGHRLTSLILHFLDTLLVFALVRVVLPDRPKMLAFWTAVLFAIHPVHETALWWISCRMELLCAFFYLTCVILFGVFMKERKGWFLFLSTLAGVLALTAKEMAYTLPCICFALALLKAGPRPPAARFRTAFLCALPMAIVAAGFMALRLTRMPVGNTLFALDVTPRHVLAVIRLTARYLAFPFHLSLRQLLRELPMAVLAAFAALAGLLWPVRRRLFSLPVALGTAWTLTTAILLVRTMSPWTLYLPSAGFCLALAAFAPMTLRPREWTAAVLTLLVLAAYTLQLETRKDAWRETDRVTRAFIEEFKAVTAEEGARKPVIVCAPGAVADIPALLHYFEMRMRLETGLRDLDPTALTFVMLPADHNRQAITFKKTSDTGWLVKPGDPETTFLFPHRGYEFQQYQSGTLVKEPWGTLRLRGANVPGESAALEVQLTPSVAKEWKNREWYGFNGKKLIAFPAITMP